jgi:hypothetical protein
VSSEIQKLKSHIKSLEKKLSDERARRPSRFSRAANVVITLLSLALGAVSLLVFWPRMTVDPRRRG